MNTDDHGSTASPIVSEMLAATLSPRAVPDPQRRDGKEAKMKRLYFLLIYNGHRELLLRFEFVDVVPGLARRARGGPTA